MNKYKNKIYNSNLQEIQYNNLQKIHLNNNKILLILILVLN